MKTSSMIVFFLMIISGLHVKAQWNINGDNTSNGNLTIGKTITSSKLLLDDPNTISDWNTIWQSGFFEAFNAANAPEANEWFWGASFNHRANRPDYKFTGQLAIKNSNAAPTLYFRSTGIDGTGIWAKALHNNGDQHINGGLSLTGTITSSKLLLDDPNTISDWNTIWQSGFFEAFNAANAPEANEWFWGASFNHRSNRPDYKFTGQLAIKNSNTTPTLYFRSTGIDGTGVWAKALHNYGNQSINGNLTVDGTLKTKQVEVKTNVWADFVFEEDYKLPTLIEVEKHIQEKGHLQDIPSAKEVEENGILLGTMNAKLLQKIEELTLYTIQQQKEIKTQSDIISRQQKDIEELKQLYSQLSKIKTKQ